MVSPRENNKEIENLTTGRNAVRKDVMEGITCEVIIQLANAIVNHFT